MISLLKSQQEQNAEIIKALIGQNAEQTRMLSEWIGLFKPVGQNRSSSLEDREGEREIASIPEEWSPMDPREFEDLLKELGE